MPLMEDLYVRAWREQIGFMRDRLTHDWMVECATPVLAFGRWERARLTTVGINPSKREFLDGSGEPLRTDAQRFLHRGLDDPEVPAVDVVAESFRRSNGYFELGNALWHWFDGYGEFLDEIDSSFRSGMGCHTDYLSPFATDSGRGNALPRNVKANLKSHGLACWFEVINAMPNLEAIVGMGAGYKDVSDKLGLAEWEGLPDFSHKAFRNYQPPYLMRTRVPDRSIALFWWRPHFGDPLGGLTGLEKRELGARIRRYLGW